MFGRGEVSAKLCDNCLRSLHIHYNNIHEIQKPRQLTTETHNVVQYDYDTWSTKCQLSTVVTFYAARVKQPVDSLMQTEFLHRTLSVGHEDNCQSSEGSV